MSTNRTSKALIEFLNNLRRDEEFNLSYKNFVATVSKGHKYSLLIISILGISIGYFNYISNLDPKVCNLFCALGITTLLMLPSCYSYRCYVDRDIIKLRYYILCFKINKEVLWKDVTYKIIKQDFDKNDCSIHLYNANKKKLISFDNSIVGFGRIMQMSNKIPKLK